jgi:nitrate/nitrite transport system permease protein
MVAVLAAQPRKKVPGGALFLRVVPPLLGLALLVLVWQIIALKTSSFPRPG